MPLALTLARVSWRAGVDVQVGVTRGGPLVITRFRHRREACDGEKMMRRSKKADLVKVADAVAASRARLRQLWPTSSW